MDTGAITILIADDQIISRAGLKVVLEKFSQIKVIGEAENGQQAIDLTKQLRPAVVVMDLIMPVVDGIEATRQIKLKSPKTHVLILSSHEDDEEIFAALGAGADGYCQKDATPANLAAAIEAVSKGICWLDPGIAKRVLKSFAAQPAKIKQEHDKTQNKFALSERERQVLDLLVEGLSNHEMAERLSLGSETIKSHMSRILQKLAVSDRTQAAVKALKEGIVTKKAPKRSSR